MMDIELEDGQRILEGPCVYSDDLGKKVNKAGIPICIIQKSCIQIIHPNMHILLHLP